MNPVIIVLALFLFLLTSGLLELLRRNRGGATWRLGIAAVMLIAGIFIYRDWDRVMRENYQRQLNRTPVTQPLGPVVPGR